jgi:putative ATP-dependent endonuclease of the OLD family
LKVRCLKIENFRGIASATVLLPDHAVLIGDNNTGKTTVLEALDLALGPDRLNRRPPVDEHDFYQGRYLAGNAAAPDGVEDVATADGTEAAEPADDAQGEPPGADPDGAEAPKIEIEVTIVDLTVEQKGRFGAYIEFWDKETDAFYDHPEPAGIDASTISEALRVTFRGWYDAAEDDFEGRTYFTRSLAEEDQPSGFSRRDKQICGFLYLRSLRTGSRALSLERGSLLDIILRLREVRPQMWEDTIARLAEYSVASDPELGISGVLESISGALKKFTAGDHRLHRHGRR